MTDTFFSLSEPHWQGLSVVTKTAVEYPRHSTIHDLILAHASLTPSRIALISYGQSISYEELAERSLLLARQLIVQGVHPADVVVVKMQRGIAGFISMLAILRAGAAYLTVNPLDPDSRIQHLIEDAKPVLILTEETSPDEISGIPVLDVRFIQEVREIDLPNELAASNPAYVMYTSGSTGQPKGVLVSHRNVVRLVMNSGIANLSSETKMLQTGAMTFDATTFELWGTLLNGGTVVIVDQAIILDAQQLQLAIKNHHITTMFLTSALFNYLSAENPALFASLQELIVGGDVVVGAQVAKVMHVCPGLQVINGYGPTENGAYSTSHRITRKDTMGRVPIGRPIANSTAYILDESGAPVAYGESGELYVGGDGVALGYLNKPELTEKFFLADPFVVNGTMYRTGDLALMRSDGVLEFLGRKDNQVKIRGFRIELNEIELTLRQHESVQQAVVCVRQRDGEAVNDRYLVGYVTSSASLDEFALRRYLVEQLPTYMVPSFLIVLDQLPLTSHGKVDLAALPNPMDMLGLPAEYVPPSNETQQRLVDVWQRTLSLNAISIVDSLFDLGVDSLVAARLASDLNQTFGSQWTVFDVLSNPTVEEMAVLLTATSSASEHAIESFAAKSDLGVPFSLSRQQYPIYVEQCKNEQSIQYNVPVIISLPADVDVARLQIAWNSLVLRHDVLRTEFKMTDKPIQQITEQFDTTLKIYPGEPLIASNLIKPFDLNAGPPWRVCLYVNGDRQWLVFDFHHLIVDGESMSQILQELDALYRGEELQPIQYQYSDFVHWAEGPGAVLRMSQKQFWMDKFSLPFSRPELPIDFQRPSYRTNASSMVTFQFEAECTQSLTNLAAIHQCTLFEILSVAYSLFLFSIMGSSDVTFGIPSSNRTQCGFDGTLGLFSNTVCMRLFLNPEESMVDFVRRVVHTTRDSLRNQNFTLNDLIDWVQPEMIPGRNPLFDTMMAFQSRKLLNSNFLNTTFYLKPLVTGQGMFDLNLQIYEEDTSMYAEWEYSTELFTSDTIVEMKTILLNIIRRMADSHEGVVSTLIKPVHIDHSLETMPSRSTYTFDF